MMKTALVFQEAALLSYHRNDSFNECKVIKLTELASISKSRHFHFLTQALLTYIVCGDLDDGGFHEVVGEDKGPFLQSIQ